MKLKFLKEECDLDTFVMKLLTKCKPYCDELVAVNGEQWNGVGLVRGMTEVDGRCGFAKINQNRSPRNSSKFMHDTFNRFFEHTFQVKKLRSRCTFCYLTNNTLIEQYGKPYVIFPIGPYRLFYSDDVYDLTEQVEEPMEEAYDADEDMGNAILEFMERAQYRETNSITHVNRKSMGELMTLVDSNQYYYVTNDLMDKVYSELVSK